MNNITWKFPTKDLLEPIWNGGIGSSNVEEYKANINNLLVKEGIDLSVIDVNTGFTYTQYVLKTSTTANITKLHSLENQLALAVKSPSGTVRIVIDPDRRSNILLEVPNENRGIVKLKPLIESNLMVTLGVDINHKPFRYDLGIMPHLLIAGTTGSGKSQLIHNILFSLFFRATPREVKLILIDPKRVELLLYADIPYLLRPVITDPHEAIKVFNWMDKEQERRYDLYRKEKVRSLDDYNHKVGEIELPKIVIIVDEFGELMVQDPQKVEKLITRVVQLSKYSEIHIVLATSRPSLNVYTGLLKANMPCRAAFNTASVVDSKVILDQPGAEKLLGKGDMLFCPPDRVHPIRLQVPFISDNEINEMVKFLKSQGSPDYIQL